jgi:hypothetical protein
LENVLGTLRPCLKWSIKPDLCAAVDAASAQPFDMHRFLSTPHASLHIICPAGEGSADAGPLVIGFIAALRKASRELGLSMGIPNGANPIPVLAPLDEVANYPMPELPNLLAVGRKYNWTMIAVFQTLAQARRGWDEHFADELLTIGGATVILPGSSEPALTSWASGLSGTKIVDRATTSDSWQRRMRVDVDAHADSEERGDNAHGQARIHGSVFPWRRWQKAGRSSQTTQTEVPRHTPQEICDLTDNTAWVKDGNRRARMLGLPLHHSVQPFKTWYETEEPAWVNECVRMYAPAPLPPPVVHQEPEEEPVAPAAAVGGTIVPISTLRDQREHRDDGTVVSGTEGA